MSNERFDKLMKKNLEAVKPGYQPRAWDRFRKRLPLSGFWPWLLQYGGWVLSALMLTGWLTTLYTLQENRRLLETVHKTLQSTTQTEVRQPVAPVQRVDTVYIVKRTVVEHRHSYRSLADATDRSGLVRSTEVLKGSGNETEPFGSKPAKRTTEAESRRQPGFGARLVSPAPPMNANRSGKTPNRVWSAGSRTPVTDDSLQTLAQTDPASGEKREDVGQALVPIPVDSQIKTPPDSAAQNGAVAPASLRAQVPKIEPKRPPFRLSSLRPRGGIETLLTRNSVGIGPVIEVFPMENLGISVGLLATRQNSEKHRGLKDFNSATGQEFIEQYRPYLPAQYDRIEEISIHTSGISLPITLKYYVPLDPKWSLSFQTGTSLDLAAYQQIKYESYFRGDEQHHAFSLKAEHRVFHNFLFGGGVQFHQSRLSAQLIPFYLYDFRSLADAPGGSNIGLKASVWIDLFK
ncbi:hypothetical protein [Larkinella humicola]|uniref:Uncharacterized protein n=1 Tax=Larkinella humicola TaxID=2607654 RepID=A0A5N1JQ22_9BACT|nr:hypothetical protein [Larkinella humicola]KAA9356402.1 hypothetical protein F0P93_01210 [Larkinella humicola]